MTGDHDEIVFPETMVSAEISLKALKHAFITQPDWLNMEQMQYLKKLAEESSVALQLGTGYKYCPVYDTLLETIQTAKVVDIRHQLVNSGDVNTSWNMILFYDFDFVTNILNADFIKFDVNTWSKTGESSDILHCRLECDNGCIVDMTFYTIDHGEPKLEMTFTSFDAVFRADIFQSVIEKQDLTCNTTDRIILDAYSEKIIHERYLENFRRIVSNELNTIRNIDRQYQNMLFVDGIVKRINF